MGDSEGPGHQQRGTEVPLQSRCCSMRGRCDEEHRPLKSDASLPTDVVSGATSGSPGSPCCPVPPSPGSWSSMMRLLVWLLEIVGA